MQGLSYHSHVSSCFFFRDIYLLLLLSLIGEVADLLLLLSLIGEVAESHKHLVNLIQRG